MKATRSTNLVIRLSIGLILALAISSSLQSRSAEPTEWKKGMMEGKMMERCQEMKAHREKTMAEMKAQDSKLAELVAAMNRAPDDKKLALMATVVTQMVEQRTAMNARMGKMQGDMMQHMQMGKESMSQCPMMNGMMMNGTKDVDAKSAVDHKTHPKE